VGGIATESSGILTVHDIGEHGGVLYVVSGLLQGAALSPFHRYR
jgi:hypothetical protein